MTVLYTNNFDAETAGTLPAGWINKTGTWVVGTTQPVSGTQTLSSTTNGDGNVVLYTGNAAVADMIVEVSTKLQATQTVMGIQARFDSANANGYSFVYSATLHQILLFKKVANAYTQLVAWGTNLHTANNFTLGDVITMEASVIGTAISVKFWNATSGTKPSTPSFSTTDSSITAPGYAGIYNAKSGLTVTMGADNFVVSDNAVPATGVLLSGPSSGSVGAPSSNFTVSANGAITGTVTVTPSDSGGGGTFIPTSVGINTASPTATFTYTPASTGVKTVSVTNDGGLTNPSSISYTSSGGTVTVLPTDANWYFSHNNWNVTAGGATAVCGGAYFKLGFSGTAIAIGVDLSSLAAASVVAGNYPIVRYTLDNGAYVDSQLTVGQTAISITGLSASNHTIELWYLAGYWENIPTTAADRWTTPSYCLKITNAIIDPGASSVAPTLKPKKLLWFGDSISEGIRANNSTTQPANQNSYETIPAFVAQALNAELGNCSFGGTNYNAGFNSIPGLLSSYASVYNGVTRLSTGIFIVQPDYIAVMMGANGAPTTSNVSTFLDNARTAAPNARIFVIVPVGGQGRTNIIAGVASYLSAHLTEHKVHIIDVGVAFNTGLTSIGGATQQAIDGLHPRSSWNARLACEVIRQMRMFMPSETQGATTKATATITLVNASGAAQASLIALKWAWWDSVTPDLQSVPVESGIIETTDVSGVLVIDLKNTQLVAGQVGWLTITDSDGTTTQSPVNKAFSGPVTVA